MKKKRATISERLYLARKEGYTDAYVAASLVTKKFPAIVKEAKLQEQFSKGYDIGFEKGVRMGIQQFKKLPLLQRILIK